MGRFINLDGFVSTGTGMTGFNMFAYCNNCPVDNSDPSGFRSPKDDPRGSWVMVTNSGQTIFGGNNKNKTGPYKSANDAAKAFSERVYSSSLYIRHEYSTEIYSRSVNGQTTYYFNPPRAGNPHSASVGYSTPAGTKTVAYAHTHPNSNYFSNTDMKTAIKLGIDAYVVGPNLILQRYDVNSADETNVCVISPNPLTENQKSSLVKEFQASWDAHISAGCDFNCKQLKWPTP